jgi:hypothetical protein
VVTNYVILLDALLLVAMLAFALRDTRMCDLLSSLRHRRSRPLPVPREAVVPSGAALPGDGTPPAQTGSVGAEGSARIAPGGLDPSLLARMALRQVGFERSESGGEQRMVPVLVMIPVTRVGDGTSTVESARPLADPLRHLAIPGRVDALRSIGIDHLRTSLAHQPARPLADARSEAPAPRPAERPRRQRTRVFHEGHLRLVHTAPAAPPATSSDA